MPMATLSFVIRVDEIYPVGGLVVATDDVLFEAKEGDGVEFDETEERSSNADTSTGDDTSMRDALDVALGKFASAVPPFPQLVKPRNFTNWDRALERIPVGSAVDVMLTERSGCILTGLPKVETQVPSDKYSDVIE